MIKKTTHSALHTLFVNDIFPEQVIRLANLSSKALKPEIVAQLMEILNQRDIHNPEEWYKEDCIWLPKRKIYK